MTLQQAITLAEKHYPSIQSKESMVGAAQANLELQHQDLIPRLDAGLQVNKATLNNIDGLYFPQNIIPPISGPVHSGNNYRPTWGSTGGLLLSWQPFTFGQRKAKINLGKATLEEAQKDLANTLFNHDLLVLDGWLNYFGARAQAQVEKVNVDRTQAIFISVKSLTESGLKPGVDSFIVKGEIAKATIAFNQANAEVAASKIRLSELIGASDTFFEMAPQNILSFPPLVNPFEDSTASAPSIKLEQSKIDIANQGLAVIQHAYRPQLSFYTSSFARGSGADFSGNNNDYSLKGLRFSKYNFAIGASLTFPILQFLTNRTRTKIQLYQISSAQFLMREQELKLQKGEQTARVYIQSSRQNFQASKLQVESAEQAYLEMNARYQAGLTTLPQLFQIQYELAKAEEENVIALISIWKSYLYFTQESGDIRFFLNQVK
ncbi:MAG: TolC family protein [Chitinophagaceae bacterium]